MRAKRELNDDALEAFRRTAKPRFVDGFFFFRTNNSIVVFLDSWIDNSIGDFLDDATVFDKENVTEREKIPLLGKKNKVVETVWKCYPLSCISCKQIQTFSQE